MNQELKKTVVCFHIIAGIYALLAVGFLGLYVLFSVAGGVGANSSSISFIAAIMSLGIVVFVEWVVRGLKERKYWAWISGIVISAICIPSILIVLGIIGLIGLADENTRRAFNR